jgi:probable F420-dependent oxidoreductase
MFYARTVRFAVSLFPLRPQQMVDVAVEAESLGFDAVWLGEHIISPLRMSSDYPYASSTEEAPAYHSHLPFYDPYAALSFIAARTTRLRLGLSLSIVPLHDPYHLARSVATIDLFSEGRFLFGVGAGWLREEFDILGRPWDRRGARLEESLEVMMRLWNDHEPSFDGEFFKLPPSAMEPKPRTLPHPPFFFGGLTPVALRRAARLGDGWIGVGLKVDEVAPKVEELQRLRADVGRGDDPIEISMIMSNLPTVEDVTTLEAAGVDQIVVRPWTKGRDAVQNVRAFASDMGLE